MGVWLATGIGGSCGKPPGWMAARGEVTLPEVPAGEPVATGWSVLPVGKVDGVRCSSPFGDRLDNCARWALRGVQPVVALDAGDGALL